MKPSGGVMFSAIVVLVGCAILLLSGGLAMVGLAIAPVPEAQAPFLRYAGALGAVLLAGAAAWGIASGVGLLRLREWARVSMIVFSALLLLMSIPGCLIFVSMPFPVPSNADDPELMRHAMSAMRFVLTGFYASLAVLGGWWIYFFNRRKVKDQFRVAATSEFTMGDVVAHLSPRRPVSITVIAWFMLLGTCLGLLTLPFYRYVFPGQHMPMFYFGILLSGWAGIVIFLFLMAVQAVAAVGLLKLRLWGRTLAIWLQILNLFNGAISFGIPANRARFQQIMAAMVPPHVLASGAIPFPFWTSAVGSLLIVIVLLWILVTRKQAFLMDREGVSELPQNAGEA